MREDGVNSRLLLAPNAQRRRNDTSNQRTVSEGLRLAARNRRLLNHLERQKNAKIFAKEREAAVSLSALFIARASADNHWHIKKASRRAIPGTRTILNGVLSSSVLPYQVAKNGLQGSDTP